ncbi:putative xylanase/chitin deacetylase [Desulfosporosinus acidiphilus SJ4]|uniref:Putative xylanase/chitin deacetylase n=1 Tax=Desulfosporosinus acidiphilus (strain DSM 22704 / JCM 16185 / SJ4) TaxID=646529 RepID=I4D0J8_DESAJ|nr:polysaccharide deacetylase family protein [Desulfosporosinus acidiphilus]AFM39322.1 putative xylanase/chitin deacetylase [Desulfosporosinus acidiphilus SJ4]
MLDVKTSSKKPVFNKYLLNYFRLGLLLLAIVIGLSLKTFYHKPSTTPNIPQPANSLSNRSLNNKSSESVSQLSPSTISAGPIDVIYELPVTQPVVYITIDDGWYPNQNVLNLMKQYHLPITTYLIEQAAEKHTEFWHEFVNAGGHIEDHTYSHPFLTHLSQADQISQISQPLNYFNQYGPPPDELRPPYGDFNSEVGQAAKDSGIKHIVMWDAEMKNSIFDTSSGKELKSGDIILLHWEPELDQELIKLMNIIQKKNLGVADLTQALNGEPLRISWLKTPLPVSKTTPSIRTGRTVGTSEKSVVSVAKKTLGKSAVKSKS